MWPPLRMLRKGGGGSLKGQGLATDTGEKRKVKDGIRPLTREGEVSIRRGKKRMLKGGEGFGELVAGQ